MGDHSMSVEPCPACGRLTGVYRDAGDPRKHDESCPLASTTVEFHVSLPTTTYNRMWQAGMLIPYVHRKVEQFGYDPRRDEMHFPMPIRTEVMVATAFIPEITVATFRFIKRPALPAPAVLRLLNRFAERQG